MEHGLQNAVFSGCPNWCSKFRNIINYTNDEASCEQCSNHCKVHSLRNTMCICFKRCILYHVIPFYTCCTTMYGTFVRLSLGSGCWENILRSYFMTGLGLSNWPRKTPRIPKYQWGEKFEELHLVGGLEHVLFSHILGIIIPIDVHIFQRGGPTTNQTCLKLKTGKNIVSTLQCDEQVPLACLFLHISAVVPRPGNVFRWWLVANMIPIHHRNKLDLLKNWLGVHVGWWADHIPLVTFFFFGVSQATTPLFVRSN